MLFIIAPHVVADGQMANAEMIAREVGKSASAAPGFVGRLVCHVLSNPNEVWSVVAWDNRQSFDDWLANRRLPWAPDFPRQVYAQGAALSEAMHFDLIDQQGSFFSVLPPGNSRLGEVLEEAPAIVIAPHVVRPEELYLGRRLIREVGESIRKAKGFIGRVELGLQGSETRLWSISTWDNYQSFLNWRDSRTRDFWWKPEINHIVFEQGALAEEAVMMQIVTRE